MSDDTRDNRPSPEALLAEAQREGRGRLKVFLGAAPGVGKTYAMLEAGHERRREGIDVVAGVIETHGRRETEALLHGIEVLPLREIAYRGRGFHELDLDALLRRRPRLALIDELAHTNIPGGKHVKRCQDVEELLEAGIDVYTTLNIQHLESLNDIVEQISGIRVRETIPDDVLATADEIELIDLAPADLIKRLQEGKVYVPEQARRAIHHFFSPGNLTALREMALRHAAERVDRQMVDYMRAHAIAGPWPARERIVVCIDENADSGRLVRVAKRSAERRGAAWVAVSVETPHSYALSEAERDRIADAMRLAQQLGGEASILQGSDVVRAVLDFARETNATQIIVGRAKQRRWLGRIAPSVTDRLIAQAREFNILLVGGEDKPRPPPRATAAMGRTAAGRVRAWLVDLAAVAMTAAISGLGLLMGPWLHVANIPVAYLLGILVIAMTGGLRPAVVASVSSFLAFNFFFIEPRFTLAVSDYHHALTLIFFLVVAVIVSNLAGRSRLQVEAMRQSTRRTTNLYEFSRRSSAAATLDDVLWAVVHHVAVTIGGKSIVLLPRGDELEVVAGYPPEDRIDERSTAAAKWAWTHGEPAGRGSATLPAAEWLFLPMTTARGPVGVLGVQLAEGDEPPAPEESRLLELLADQAAVAIERTTLVADIEAARLDAERERLRSTLLSSLSHDLRTPLVSIVGAASSLIDYEAVLPAESRRDLAQTIEDEAERLNRFVQNLLDMTRLGAGALKPRTDWVDLRDVVGAAVERARRLAVRHQIRIDLDPALPLISVDPVLIEQVFFNLLDNACKYAPAGSVILVWARALKDQLAIEVCDEGPGIPPEDRQKVFDMFYRVKGGDSKAAGTGLGLAICRGIIEAHGGSIYADAGLNGVGTCIVLRLPLPAEKDVPVPPDEATGA